ncbi:hypothetical protein Glove_329g52 [Diversispora epigaea]|uniref:Pyridoxal phosphate phosphatase phospho2 n=1 Tax=Diversispora epigaea TaxID=1348612 RepID=A0A397HKD2_9GLOM|nr:hypothetical protein Glove_329g52 [Diversispora epigaea]
MKLFVFDFDWSLIDENSDTWIIEQFSPTLRAQMNKLREEYQWTDLMNYLVGKLYDQGISKQQIEQMLAKIPFHVDMISALKLIKEANHNIIIISDSNTIFIEEILKAHGILDLFSGIISNPANWQDNGQLNIQRLMPKTDPPHNCKNKCAENICKGKELMNYLTTLSSASSQDYNNDDEKKVNYYDQIIYVGDSSNDFCPATRMSRNDILLVRKDYSLERFIKKLLTTNDKDLPTSINPRIIYWKDGSEILDLMKVELL